MTWSGIVAAISLGTLGLLLVMQDLLRSLIGGIFLIMERPSSIGDRISVRDVTGRVIGIESRATIIRSDEGHRIVAPISIVFTNTLTNYSLRRQIHTSLVVTGISGSPDELRGAIESAISNVGSVTGPVNVGFKTRSTKVRAPAREKHSASPAQKDATAPFAEVWVSWLGGGEPEVQAEVPDRLRALYP